MRVELERDLPETPGVVGVECDAAQAGFVSPGLGCG
jgi:hypothetical protein